MLKSKCLAIPKRKKTSPVLSRFSEALKESGFKLWLGFLLWYSSSSSSSYQTQFPRHHILHGLNLISSICLIVFLLIFFCFTWILIGKGGEGIVIAPHDVGGHLLGGTDLWKITKDGEDVFYAVDFNRRKEMYICYLLWSDLNLQLCFIMRFTFFMYSDNNLVLWSGILLFDLILMSPTMLWTVLNLLNSKLGRWTKILLVRNNIYIYILSFLM